MSVLKILQIFFLSRVVLAYTPFRLTDCTNSSNRLLTISGYPTQYPIQLPGDIRVVSRVDIHRPVSPGHLRLDATIQKWIVFDYFTLPCFANFGSCSYDICDLLSWFEDRGCPWQLEESNFPCMCPFTNGTYTLEPHPFSVPASITGDFRVFGSLVDENTSEEVACYAMEFSFERAPTVWQWW